MNPVTVKTTHEIPKLVKTLVYVYSRNGTSIIMADISLPFAPVNSHKPLLCEEVIQINGKFPHNETENSLKVFTRFYFVLFFLQIFKASAIITVLCGESLLLVPANHKVGQSTRLSDISKTNVKERLPHTCNWVMVVVVPRLYYLATELEFAAKW